MKIALYCQHVLGIGHFFRTLEISRGFDGHEVVLITGGPEGGVSVPGHVRELRLPALMTDRSFSHLLSNQDCRPVPEIKAERQKLIFDFFKTASPDVWIVELYPFGRKKFRFELDPVLEGIRNGELPKCRVICSLRDILVEKDGVEKYEARVIDTLNRYFDALLVHTDPDLVKLNETFSRTDDIAIPLIYTGFVTPKPEPGARERLRDQLDIGKEDRLVVASAGGGNVGEPLLEAVTAAFGHLDAGGAVHLHVFTCPFMNDETFDRLQARGDGNVRVSRFTSDFLSYLAAADLSVSMAGYNTCMNIMAAQVPALVWPFSENREQRYRAERLAQLGALEILSDDDLKPERLAALMDRNISRKHRPQCRIDLDGAANTVRWVEGCMGEE